RPKQLSTFLVEKGTPGFTVGKQIRKMGIRWEDTAALWFSDCRIPALNHVDGDLKKTLQSFSESRPVVAAYALGVSRAALEYTWGQLRSAGIAPDYNTHLSAQSAAAARLLVLEAAWEADCLTLVRAKAIEQR